MNKTVVSSVVIAIVFGAGGFAGGVAYQKKQTPTMPDRGMLTARRDGALPPGPGGSVSQRSFGGGVNGEVQSIDDQSLTIKSANGSVQTVYLSEGTSFTKDATGALSDIAVGSNIFVTGSNNSDNSVTANVVRIGSN